MTLSSDINIDELRYHSRLRQYWEEMRGKRLFPQENDINPDDLMDIWDSCFLISIDDVTHRLGYRYSYMGENLIEAYGNGGEDASVCSSLVSTDQTPMVRKFDEAVRTKQPVTDESEFVNMNNMHIRYRSCILPLGNPAGVVTHLLGCMRWKMY